MLTRFVKRHALDDETGGKSMASAAEQRSRARNVDARLGTQRTFHAAVGPYPQQQRRTHRRQSKYLIERIFGGFRGRPGTLEQCTVGAQYGDAGIVDKPQP